MLFYLRLRIRLWWKKWER